MVYVGNEDSLVAFYPEFEPDNEVDGQRNYERIELHTLL